MNVTDIKEMRIILFIIPLLFLLSCEDALQLLPPDGQVKDEYWKKKEDVKATLMGAYGTFASLDYELFYFGELRGDLLQPGNNLNNAERSIMNSNIYPSNNLLDWKLFYQVINYCNSVLKYSPQVKANDHTFSDFKYKAYNAEAVFLRSLAYFYLVRIFKDVPFILQPYDSDNQDFFPTKLKGDIILDSLELQLNRIHTHIPLDYETVDKTHGRATRGAVNALLADIALWNFDYESCIEYIERIEDTEMYELLPGGKWFNIYSKGNTIEGIFELQFDSNLGQYNDLAYYTASWSNIYYASNYIYDILTSKTIREVVRMNGTIVPETQIIWKYIGQQPDGLTYRPGGELNSANWIIYRLADILLMKAEALSQIGRYQEALSIVNKIRIRAFVEPAEVALNPVALEDLILEERARELAFEGKRWFDLLRMGRRNNYERKAKLIEIIIKNAPATQKRVLASKLNDPFGWYFPIRDIETENNPNLIQNPYYQIYDR